MFLTNLLVPIALLHAFANGPKHLPEMPVVGCYDKHRGFAQVGSEDSVFAANLEDGGGLKQYHLDLGAIGHRFWLAHEGVVASAS